jgi:hypothetical protein
VRFDNLFERIDPVDDRSHLACLDQLLEHEQVLEPVAAIGVGVDVDVDAARSESFPGRLRS